MQDDQIIETYIPPPHPRGIELSGQWVRLEPLDIGRHSEDLFDANNMDPTGANSASTLPACAASSMRMRSAIMPAIAL